MAGRDPSGAGNDSDHAMSPPSRDDFFTLIHKGLRRELFTLTTWAGTMDWDDPDDVMGFGARWSELHHLLESHAAHEDEHFFPLLTEAAPDVVARMHVGHQEQDQALAQLSAVVGDALEAPTSAMGLEVHRHLSAFVAGYLLHLLEEETVVMPAIWQHHSDEDLARTRRRFLAASSPADAALSRRVMLPAMTPTERTTMLGMLRSAMPPPAFAAVLEDARQLLSERDWKRLSESLAKGAPAP